MKICFITQNLFGLGGIQRVLSLMLNKLSVKQEYEITILMSSVENKENLFEFSKDIKIKSFADLDFKTNKIHKNIIAVNKRLPILDVKGLTNFISKIKFSEYNKKKYIDFINTEKFDIVIGVGDSYPILVAEIAKRIQAKTIGWNHSPFDSYFKQRGKSNYGILNYCKSVMNNLDEILVLNNTDKKIFDSEFNINSKVMYNPICSNENKISKLENKNIVFAGRLVKETKGLEYLVLIIKEILEKDKDVNFTILGDGKDRPWLEEEVNKIPNNKNIKVLGNVNNVFDYYQNSTLLVQTSRWEGFGMTILEAMSCGVPVVSFHNDGPDEIIRDGIDGYLIEKFDTKDFTKKCLTILNNEDLRMKMGFSSIERSKDFALDKILGNFENILKDLKEDK